MSNEESGYVPIAEKIRKEKAGRLVATIGQWWLLISALVLASNFIEIMRAGGKVGVLCSTRI